VARSLLVRQSVAKTLWERGFNCGASVAGRSRGFERSKASDRDWHSTVRRISHCDRRPLAAPNERAASSILFVALGLSGIGAAESLQHVRKIGEVSRHISGRCVATDRRLYAAFRAPNKEDRRRFIA